MEPGQDRTWSPAFGSGSFSANPQPLGVVAVSLELMGGCPGLTHHSILRILIFPFKPQKEVWALA